jgi:hypothetical protein
VRRIPAWVNPRSQVCLLDCNSSCGLRLGKAVGVSGAIGWVLGPCCSWLLLQEASLGQCGGAGNVLCYAVYSCM